MRARSCWMGGVSQALEVHGFSRVQSMPSRLRWERSCAETKSRRLPSCTLPVSLGLRPGRPQMCRESSRKGGSPPSYFRARLQD